MAWNAWKRCCKKVDSQGEHFTVIHDRFLRDPSDGQNNSAKSGMNLRKKTIPINSLQRKGEDTMVSSSEQSRQKWAYEALMWLQSRCHDEQPLTPRISQVNKDAYDKDNKFSLKMTCPALELTNTQDGIVGFHSQLPRGGTHPKGVGSELTFFYFAQIFFFCYSGFRLRSIAIHCNRRGVSTDTPHTRIFRHFHPCSHITLWLKVSNDVSA